jgi:hypothetical protein
LQSLYRIAIYVRDAEVKNPRAYACESFQHRERLPCIVVFGYPPCPVVRHDAAAPVFPVELFDVYFSIWDSVRSNKKWLFAIDGSKGCCA